MGTATKTRPSATDKDKAAASDKATTVAAQIASKSAPAKAGTVKGAMSNLDDNQPVAGEAKSGTSKITSRVIESGGLLKITLGDLRDELGFSRLGKHVLGRMAMHLSTNNLGYFPTDLLDPEFNAEPRQWQEVWVFINDGSPRAAVMQAIGNPEEFDLVGALDQLEGSGVPGEVNYSKMTLSARLAEIARLASA